MAMEQGGEKKRRPEKLAVEPASIELGLDIAAAAGRMARFLRIVDRAAPSLFDAHVVANAARRYELLWMPLRAARRDDDHLVAPLDVRWVWHCHMLGPINYRKDCDGALKTGGLIDNKQLSEEEAEQGYEHSANVWQSAYPDEPYDYAASVKRYMSGGGGTEYERLSSYDIAAAVQRQRNFNYQSSLPHHVSPLYLEDTVDRYRNYLALAATFAGSGESFSPCFDNDLLWHTHQVHPAIYASDTEAVVGRVLNHNDNITEEERRTSGATADELWATYFDEPLWRRGAMFRGHKAPGLLDFVQWAPDAAGDKKDTRLDLSLSVGEFVEKPLLEGAELHDLCHMAALFSTGLGAMAWTATHRLVDASSSTGFTVRVVHSLAGLLSLVLVYEGGRGECSALLAAAHLIGPDALPSEDQLDEHSRRTTPHLGESHERGMVVFDKVCDVAVLTARWHPFRCEQAATCVGNLQVELFDLMRDSVLKFDFATDMAIGDATVNVATGTLRCGSRQAAERIACAFATAILYAQCDPGEAEQARRQWPLMKAAVGGALAPGNKTVFNRLKKHVEHGGEGDPSQWLAAGCAADCKCSVEE